MTVVVSIPRYRRLELEWTCSVLFGEILGINCRVEERNITGVEIALPNGSRLSVADGFFRKYRYSPNPFVTQHIPRIARFASNTFVPESNIPVIFGTNHLEIEPRYISCGIDIFSSCFFMLSRWEEIASNVRDQHDRFPGSESLAYKADFLYRPVVNEYAEMLWAMLEHLCPRLERASRRGKVMVTCDVDSPFDPMVRSIGSFGKTLTADLIKRRNIGLAINRILRYSFNRLGRFDYDPFYTFDWYLDTCERHGRRATFFFIPDHSGGAIDGFYNLCEPRILALIKTIVDRGHDVGMHGSYNTYNDAVQIKKERLRLIDACRKAGVVASVQGNRQHYLRWDAAQTPDHIDAAGFEYDTSGAYADVPGFRYGTSQTFAMWSWKNNGPLKVKQRPLVLMECSVLDDSYLGLKYSKEAMELMLMLKQRALKYGGDFVLLWHNSHLTNDADRHFFVELIQ